MKLLVLKDGISIQYNQNEHNIETVFSLDTMNKIIQHFTFQCHIHYDPIILEQVIMNITNTTDISHGFLFYSFRYQISFHHFLMQTLPLLDSYLKSYPTYTLLIPKHHYTIFVKDILSLLSIQNILLLEDHTIYNIAEFADRNWLNDSCLEMHPTRYSIFNLVRQQLNILPNTAPSRKIYLKKDGIVNPNFGNSETGILRKILNEDALIDQLKMDGFEIIHLGDKLLHEKKALLENAHIIVTQLGANCMNLLFTNAPKHLLFLSNATAFGKDFFCSISQIYNNTPIHTHTLIYPNDPVHFDPTNSMNAAFTVSIEEITNYVANCI